MGGWDNGGAKDTTIKRQTEELLSKVGSLNDSICKLDGSTSKSNNIMILLTLFIFLLTVVLVFIGFITIK